MKEDKVAEEVAEQLFDQFAEDMDLDIDENHMDEDELASFNKAKRSVITAIRRGSLVFNEDGEAVYTPQHRNAKNTDPITFHERTGVSLMAMDGRKKNHEIAKTFAVIASMCKVPVSTISGLVGVDSKVVTHIFTLLMD